MIRSWFSHRRQLNLLPRLARPAAPMVLILLVVVAFPGRAHADGDSFAAACASMLERAEHPWVAGDRFPDVAVASRALYAARAGGPVWLVDGRPTAAARAIAARLPLAADWGLRAADYRSPELDGVLRRAESGAHLSPADLARCDLALTVQALRLVAALSRGRVSAERAHATLKVRSTPYDIVAGVDSIARGADVDAVLRSAQPPWLHYHLLLEALARYRHIALDTSLVPLRLPRKLSPGDPYPEAARLRRYLLTLRDLPLAAAPPSAADTAYGPELVEGVRSFQERNGMSPDGVIGSRTAQRLNRPLTDRVSEIELALERWRWLPRSFDVPPIVVNIPAFRLYAFRTPRDDEGAMLLMDVVVGRAYKTETPVFTETMKYVIFQPYWEVPYSIATQEIRPAARRSPGYLAKHQFELLRGNSVVPAIAENIEAIGRGVRVRQKPGDQNSLGSVKFMLPNPHNVYLHDTNAKSRFLAERRDFSHGCIRVSDPVALAEHVLGDQPEWTRQRIEAAMAAGTSQQVYLTHPIPVYVVYTTALARADGRVMFFPDVYGHDHELRDLLARGYPYPE